jgi:hypothetical protein
MPAFNQCRDMILDRASADLCRLDHIADGDATVLARQLQNLDGKLRQRAEDQAFPFQFSLQPDLLFGQGAKEELQPWKPVRLVRANRPLCLAESQVVPLLELLDHALKRAVRNIGVSGAQQQECGQDSRQTTVAVLERVDRQKRDDEYRDDDQRMQLAVADRIGSPLHEIRHHARRVERGGRLEDDTYFLPRRIEGHDVIAQRLVLAAMALVLRRVLEQVPVKLTDMVLGQCQVLPVIERSLTDSRIARDLLLVPGREGLDVDVGEQLFDLAVGQLRALDAGGRGDALDGCNALERG